MTSSSLPLLLAFLGLHALLAIAMKELPILATAHAVVAFLVALYWAASSRSAARVVIGICYLAGAEVLWRMTSAAVFWEFGKYAICAVLLLWLLRNRPRKFNWLALLYIGLLMPSVILTLQAGFGFNRLRQVLSFNLSGPLSLVLCAFCLLEIRLSHVQTSRALLALIGPVAGVAALCLFGTATLPAGYEFGTESNFITSGGFGPNQVSATLGLGMLIAFLWMQRQKPMSARWWLAIALLLFFAGESTFTFSRTGVWLGILTICVASFFLVRQSATRLAAVIAAFLVFGCCYLFVFESLDSFTGGSLSERYTESNLGNRVPIARGDLQLAIRNPLLGVGPGMAEYARRAIDGISEPCHTEFTRLLAEHGLAGLLALGALLAMAGSSLKRASSSWQQAWTGSLIAYSLLFMVVSGMRLAAPAVTIGLALLKLPEPENCWFCFTRANDSRRVTPKTVRFSPQAKRI